MDHNEDTNKVLFDLTLAYKHISIITPQIRYTPWFYSAELIFKFTKELANNMAENSIVEV